MSTPFEGSYTADLFNASKRYRVQFQKAKALADSELREIWKAQDSYLNQLIHNNFPRGSSTNNGFKVIQSTTTTTQNFEVMGGDGTVNGAGVLFVDGYILFLKSNIQYNQQDATGALTDDDYTKTTIPALTTPGSNRTDEVYVDFYFAEVSSAGTPEYTDATIIVSGIGSATANRVRMVQDIRVAQGSVTPTDGVDGNGIYHKYVKIATIARLAGNATILTAMITDNRNLINPVHSYTTGTANSIKLVNGAEIGDNTHRISKIWMSSTIDYAGTLLFNATNGKIGIGSAVPVNTLDIVSTGVGGQIFKAVRSGTEVTGGDTGIAITASNSGTTIGNVGVNTLTFTLNSDEKISLRTNEIRLANGGVATKVGINTIPQTLLHVGAGTTRLDGDLQVNGTTTTFNTETVATDQISINQDENQTALVVNKIGTGAGTGIALVNSGTSPAMTITGNPQVGIGTLTPQAYLHVEGPSIVGKQNGGTTLGDGGRRFGALYLNSAIDFINDLHFDSTAGEIMRITPAGNLVGIGTNNPQNAKLNVWGDIKLGIAGLGTQSISFARDDGSYNFAFLRCEKTAGSQNLRLSSTGGGAKLVLEGNANILAFNDTGSYFSGNLGIGTDNPTQSLHIYNVTTSNYYALIESGSTNNNSGISFKRSDGVNNCQWYIYPQTGTKNVVFHDGVTTRVTFQYGGNVGIGTANPATKLHLEGADDTLRIKIGEYLGAGSPLYISARESARPSMATGHMGAFLSYQLQDTGDNYVRHLNIGANENSAPTSGGADIRFFTVAVGGGGGHYDGSERMRIRHNGYVGIGADVPDTIFHVKSTYGTTQWATIEQASNNSIGVLIKRSNSTSYDCSWFLYTAQTTKDFFISDDTGDKLTIKYSTGRVGIGTISPAQALDVNGNGVFSTRVGIGTTVPNNSTKLHIYDKVSNATLMVESATALVSRLRLVSGTQNFDIECGGTNTNLVIRDPASGWDYLGLKANKVGIGTTDPTEVLDVNGSARCYGTNPAIKAYGTNGAFLQLAGGSLASGSRNYELRAFTGVNGLEFVKWSDDWVSQTSLMTILGTGNIGIGTTIPAYNLHIQDTTNTAVTIETTTNTSAAWLKLKAGGASDYVTLAYTGPSASSFPDTLVINDNLGKVVSIKGDYVGIGTFIPTSALDVISTGMGGSIFRAVRNSTEITGGVAAGIVMTSSDAATVISTLGVNTLQFNVNADEKISLRTDEIRLGNGGVATKVGIATSPAELFHVGAGTSRFDGRLLVNTGNRVGIGTLLPLDALHIYVAATPVLHVETKDATSNSTLKLKAGGTADFTFFQYYGASHGTYPNTLIVAEQSSSGNLTIKSGQMYLGTGTPVLPTAPVDIGGDKIRVRTAKTPANQYAPGNTGDICWDTSYIYVCVATSSWKRAAIADGW